MANILRALCCLILIATFISCSDEKDGADTSNPSTVTVSGTLPVMYIETEGHRPVVSKDEYLFIPHWIGEIIQYESFCRMVEAVWREVYPARLAEVYSFIDETVLPLEEAWKHDCERWKDDPKQTASLRAERLKTALRRNIEWFDGHLPVCAQALDGE